MQLKKRILGMEDDAQREIQKLLEARDAACSGENVRRCWEVVGFMERPRRKITLETGKGKWWKKGKKNAVVEWVLVIKGETVDHKSRVEPKKHENPWNPKPKPVVAAPVPRPVVNRMPNPQVQNPAGMVLRHVENRRVLSVEEAEKKMDGILKELFKRGE